MPNASNTNMTTAVAEQQTADLEKLNTLENKLLGFKWNKKKVQACFLISLGKYTNTDISRTLKLGKSTLTHWSRYEEFQKKVNEFILTSGYSETPVRVQSQKRIVERIEMALLDKFDSPIDVRGAKLTALLTKYFEGMKAIKGEAIEKSALPSRNASINIFEIIDSTGDPSQKKELRENLRQAVLSAISRRRGIIDIKPENIKVEASEPANDSRPLTPDKNKTPSIDGKKNAEQGATLSAGSVASTGTPESLDDFNITEGQE